MEQGILYVICVCACVCDGAKHLVTMDVVLVLMCLLMNKILVKISCLLSPLHIVKSRSHTSFTLEDLGSTGLFSEPYG